MDTIALIIDTIKDLGFPAASVLLMWLLCKDTQSRQDQQNIMWHDALEKNTAALNELSTVVKAMNK